MIHNLSGDHPLYRLDTTETGYILTPIEGPSEAFYDLLRSLMSSVDDSFTIFPWLDSSGVYDGAEIVLHRS